MKRYINYEQQITNDVREDIQQFKKVPIWAHTAQMKLPSTIIQSALRT